MLPQRFEMRVHAPGVWTLHQTGGCAACSRPARASALHLVAGLPRFKGRLREHTGVRPSVLADWVALNQPLEGVLSFMYTDAENLVTTGMGDLVDASQSGSSTPWAPALLLPWKNPDGSLADQGTVIAQWQAVKNGGVNSSVNAGYLTTIRLDAAGIQQAVSTTMASDENQLRSYFPDWDNIPADAQAGILSMSWAMGSGFPRTFTQFTAAINAGRYAAAADLSDFQGIGIQERVAMNKAMFNNAQLVVDGGYDPATLYWPNLPSSWWPSWMGTAAKVAGVVVAAAAGIGSAYLIAEHTNAMEHLDRLIPKAA
jgi:hypothetical protein